MKIVIVFIIYGEGEGVYKLFLSLLFEKYILDFMFK